MQALADHAEGQGVQLPLVRRRDRTRRRIPGSRSNCGRIASRIKTSEADVGWSISRSIRRCRQSSGIVDRQDVAQEVVDESPELLRRLAGGMAASASGALEAAAMGIQHRLDVELLLVAEMIIDRRHVRPGPLADRPDPRRIESLPGKLLARRLEQPNLRRILYFHRLIPFQTPVSNRCFNQLYPSSARRQCDLSRFCAGRPF